MKMRKIFASIAAVAAASALTMSVSAADWSQAGYADNDPATVNIISTDENGATFGATSDGAAAKLRITLDQILENPDDVSKIKSGSWKVTYNGLSAYTGTAIGWVGGGTYAATGNSAGYGLAPNEWAEDGTAIWEDSQTVEDSFKYLLPSSVPTDASAAEFVFMDWSGADVNIFGNGVTVTISDLKLFDADGNEIAQKAYSGAAAEVVEEAAPVETEAAEVVEETAAPAADASTTPAATGNAAAASVAAVMAVAGAAAFISRRK